MKSRRYRARIVEKQQKASKREHQEALAAALKAWLRGPAEGFEPVQDIVARVMAHGERRGE